MNVAGDWADTLAEKILGAHCACYAEAWPAHTCANEVAEVAKLIRAFFSASRLVVVAKEPTEAMVEAAFRCPEYAIVAEGNGRMAAILRAAIAAAKEPPQCPES